MTAYKFSTTGVQRRPCGIYVGSPTKPKYFDNPYMSLSDFGQLWNNMIASARAYSSTIDFPPNSALDDSQFLFENMWNEVLDRYSKAGQTFNPDTTFIMGDIRYIYRRTSLGFKRDHCEVTLRLWANMYWNNDCKMYLSNDSSSPVNVPYNNTNIITGHINESATYPTTSTGEKPLWFYIEGYNPNASVRNNNVVMELGKYWENSRWYNDYWTINWYQYPFQYGQTNLYARINQVTNQTYRLLYGVKNNPFDNLTGFNDISNKPTSYYPFNCVITNLNPEIVNKIRQTS